MRVTGEGWGSRHTKTTVKISPREFSIVPRYPSGVLTIRRTGRLVIYYPHAIGKIMCKPRTLFYLGRYGEIYSSLCWSGSEHVLGTRLGLLGRGVGVAARPRYRLREAHRDADNVGVLRVFPLGQ